MQCWNEQLDDEGMQWDDEDDVSSVDSDALTEPIEWADGSDDDSYEASLRDYDYVGSIVNSLVEHAVALQDQPSLPPEGISAEPFLDALEARLFRYGAHLAVHKAAIVARVRQYSAKGQWGKALASRFGNTLKRLNALAKYATRFPGSDNIAPANLAVRIRSFFYDVPHRVRKVAVGESHALFLSDDGRAFGMGTNTYGQLGSTAYRRMFLSQEFESLGNGVTDVACGYSTSFVTNDEGTFACGANANGRLGIGTEGHEECRVGAWTKMVVPFALEKVCAGSTHGAAIGGCDKRLYTWGKSLYTGRGGLAPFHYGCPQRVDSIGCVLHVAIFYAGYHTVVVDALGQAWGFGHNRVGQLGKRNGIIATTPVRYDMPPCSVERVLVGWGNTAFVSGRTLRVIGRNCEGQCGVDGGEVNSLNTPFRSEFVDLPLDGDAAFFSTTALHVGGVVYGKVTGRREVSSSTVAVSETLVVERV